MTLMDSLADLTRLGQSLMDRVDGVGVEAMGRTVNPIPFDLAETPDALLIYAYLPGFRQEDVRVEVRDHRLAVEAERHLPSREDLSWLQVEAPYGTFLRTISLGPGIVTDRIEAAWHDGVLTLRLPKAEDARPRRIPIQTAERPALENGSASA